MKKKKKKGGRDRGKRMGEIASLAVDASGGRIKEPPKSHPLQYLPSNHRHRKVSSRPRRTFTKGLTRWLRPRPYS